jgi:flagellar basal body-associated protein FliL
MTKENNESNQNKTRSKKRNYSILIKALVIFFSLICLIILFNFWQDQIKNSPANKVKQAENENELFDFSDDYDHNKCEDFSDITIKEMKEKGAEFLYQTIYKNQIQINDLKEQINSVKDEINKYKSQERIGKTIISYIELREAIFSQKYQTKPDDKLVKNFELLASLDEKLNAKFSRLKPAISNFVGQYLLSKDFAMLIPELITNKNRNYDQNLIGKIRKSIAKIVIIRRINQTNLDDVDGIIARTEAFLKEQEYQKALDSLTILDDSSSHEILSDFLIKLQIAVEVKKIDEEIFNYLKTCT